MTTRIEKSPGAATAIPTRCIARYLCALAAAIGLAVGMAGPAHAANIVANGGFETGDFTDWVELDNFTFSDVVCPDPSFVPQPTEGICEGEFGPAGLDGTLAQGLNTVAGQTYVITFDFFSDGGTPSDFSATFGGVPLIALTNPPANGYQSFSFLETATSANTTLAFSFRDDPGHLYLDNVGVSLPEPASAALLGIGLSALFLLRRRTA